MPTQPYPDGILTSVLRCDEVEALVVTRLPADYLACLPVLLARATTGGTVKDLRHSLAQYAVQLDAYAPDAPGAHDLVDAALSALSVAQQSATVTAHGYITNVQVTSPPGGISFPDSPPGVARRTATVLLTVRS